MQKFPQDSGLVAMSNKPLDLGVWNLIRKKNTNIRNLQLGGKCGVNNNREEGVANLCG